MTDPRRRIIRIIARLNVGGPSRQVILLHRRLSTKGWDSLLVHGQVGDHEASLEHLAREQGVVTQSIRELGRRIRPWSDLVALCRTIALLYRVRPDVVHTHTAKAGTLGRVAAAVYNASRPRQRRCFVVHTFHGHVLDGYFGPIANQLVRMTERGLAHLSDRLIAISERQRDDLVSRYRIARADAVALVPLGLELTSLLEVPSRAAARAGLGVPQDAVVVAFVGRLVLVKQPVAMIDAFAVVCARCPAARLLVVGDGELRESMEEAIRRHDLTSRVMLLGWRSDLRAVYGATDVVALTSRSEGTPVALIEAMAAGKAVVATSVGGVPDLIVDGVNGLLVPVGDTGAMADALTRLIQHPEERDCLGRAGRAHVMTRYSADRLATDLDRMYRLGLQERRRRPDRELAE
jgi:glycosyltransferase involved in cell wall biosynthesis